VTEFLSLSTLKEILKFNIAGFINTVLAYLVYSVLILLGFTYIVALIADYAFAILFSLVVNKSFTFGYKKNIEISVVIKMVFSYLFMYFVNLFFLWCCVTANGMNVFVSQALSVFLIAALSYVLQKFFVFRPVRNGKSNGSHP
jgi:putative flippase GtrA